MIEHMAHMDLKYFHRYRRRRIYWLLAIAALLAIATFLLASLYAQYYVPGNVTQVLVAAFILVIVWAPVFALALVVASEQPFSVSPDGIAPVHRPFRYWLTGKTVVKIEEISKIRVASAKGELYAKVLARDGTLIEIRESQGIPRKAFALLEDISGRMRERGEGKDGS
ncbi:MAG: hypothetical protein E6K17_08885 [Methanobacteriota archaeon]|nr:MAG: hypothetical protein E6K17_08885 [Euryarchaeota archaeon]